MPTGRLFALLASITAAAALFTAALLYAPPPVSAVSGTERTVTVRFEDPSLEPQVPAGAVMTREGELVKIAYAPREIPTPELVALLQQAGPIREMTIQPQNIDYLIASMYREMDL